MSEELQVTPISSQDDRGFLDGNPRTMFTFGLVSGMALILLLNNFMGLSSGTAVAKTVGNTPTQVVAAGNDTDPAPQVAKVLEPVSDSDHIRGDIKKAKVVLIEYSDFQCPYCGKHDPTMQKIMDEYGDDVAWVYRHFPLSFHPNAIPAAIGSECANEQGKFWEFADAMYADQAQISGSAADADAFIADTAKALGLNMSSFNTCLDSGKYDDVIDADLASGSAAGVSGTPATFVNGTLVSGAVPYANFAKIIDDALKN